MLKIGLFVSNGVSKTIHRFTYQLSFFLFFSHDAQANCCWKSNRCAPLLNHDLVSKFYRYQPHHTVGLGVLFALWAPSPRYDMVNVYKNLLTKS